MLKIIILEGVKKATMYWASLHTFPSNLKKVPLGDVTLTVIPGNCLAVQLKANQTEHAWNEKPLAFISLNQRTTVVLRKKLSNLFSVN